jgi:hypothetical protein
LVKRYKIQTNYISRYYKSLHAKITKPKRGGGEKKKGQLESKDFMYFDKQSYLHLLKIKKNDKFPILLSPPIAYALLKIKP